MATFAFDQIKLQQNENISASVFNRALLRLWKNIDDLETMSAFAIPEAMSNESTFLVDLYDESTGEHTKAWYSFSDFDEFVPNYKLTELSDMVSTTPNSGETIMWNSASGMDGLWQFKTLPTKLQHLEKLTNLAETPNENDVLTYSTASGWIAQPPVEYLGVGYIYHQTFNSPTIINLPETEEALSGGEQVVITKLLNVDRDTTYNYPILIKSSQHRILNDYAIVIDNDDEEFSSIHIRACLDQTTGEYIWVPVCATGSWRPTDLEDLSSYSCQNISTTTLTANEIKLQPYNIDISFSLNSSEISKSYDMILNKIDSIWTFDSDNSTANVSYYNGIFSINHNILEGILLTKTTVYYYDTINGYLSQVIPDEIYFKTTSSNYGTTCVDIKSWLSLSSISNLTFKAVISI